MSIFYVRKDGSGTHTTIQSAIFAASSGDTIDIGAGTFYENIEFYKSVILKGAGKDVTIIQGKLANDTFTGCTYYPGEDIINLPSTSGLIVGRAVSGTGLSGVRIQQILSSTQAKLTSTTTGATYSKTGVNVTSGVSTLTVPNVTSLAVGQKVVGTGIATNATITAINATTKVLTLSAPNTGSATNQTIVFKPVVSITLTMPSSFTGSTIPATIQVMNSALWYWQIKDMTIIGFDGNTNVEASALGINNPSSGSHQNWLIDNCKLTANGDSALVTAPNLSSLNGTIQNCVFNGKTFSGSTPAEVPAFSSFTRTGNVLSSTTIEMPSVDGIYGHASLGSPISGTGLQASTIVTAISGNVLTLSKTMTASIGSSVLCTFSNVQFSVPNVARQLCTIGNSSSVSACLNMTFKNNTISGQTGAAIGSNKNMFNTAVTVDTVGGLIENNLIDGIFGAGTNTLVSNFAIRSRGANVVVQNNTNKTSGGRGNSGFYIPLGTSINNITLDLLMVQNTQPVSGQTISFQMDKDQVKSISKVASDAFYSDSANWHMVSFVYKNGSNNKRLTPSFKSFADAKVSKLRYGMMSGDVMQLHKIIISKSNRQHLVIKRSEIDGASAFDFTLANSSTAAAWSGNHGSGTGGSGSGENVATAYKYYKFSAKSGWNGTGSPNAITNVIGISDIAFKDASGSTISMTGASVNNIMQSSNYGAANMINGSVEQANAQDLVAFGMPDMNSYHDLFTITLASAASVSKLLIGPQGGTGESYNMPREFKLLASNDNVNFTEVYVSAPDATSSTWFNYKGTYREFTL